MGFIIASRERRWFNNTIPFEIDDAHFPTGTVDKQSIENAISTWNATGYVKLAVRSGEPDYIRFVRPSTSRCESSVGRKGGLQLISCDVGSFSAGNVMHEIGHALGLIHEHQRSDRDDFVTVDPSVINDHNYRIDGDGRKVSAYDCGSIMHYGNIPGKISNRSSSCAGMGQRITLSMGDIAAIAALPTFPFESFCGIEKSSSGNGYLLVETRGGVVYFGDAIFHGSRGGRELNKPICGIAATLSGKGYWLVAKDGGVFTFGDAPFHGSQADNRLNAEVCGIASTPSGNGYWLVAKDGGVFTHGDAPFHGSMGGQHLNKPVCGMAPTPSGNGYWLVAEDGGVFTFGDAPFHGSRAGDPLNDWVCGMAATPSGNGYWLVAKDGGVFTFGDAPFHGSMGGEHLNRPVCGISATPSGNGYWLVAEDGGVFTFGDAAFFGSAVDSTN